MARGAEPVTVAITGMATRTCLGGLNATYEALLAGRSGVAPLRPGDPATPHVTHGYPINEPVEPVEPVDHPTDHPAPTEPRPAAWLARCVADALRDAGVDPDACRVAVVVGTGMGELRAVERWYADGAGLRLAELHFGAAVRTVVPRATEVHTLSTACSASGYALGLAMDLLTLGEADAVVAAGCDTMTASMLTTVGRVNHGGRSGRGGGPPADMVRPFDADQRGVLLGEGAAAVVLEPGPPSPSAHGVLRGVGLGCDAYDAIAPDRAGIVATMRDAHRRAGVTPDQVGLVLAHGTGTALNDPAEAAALCEVFGAYGRPPVTGIKGAIGHTSGAAALMGVQIAVTALRTGKVPPAVGLRTPAREAGPLNLVHGGPAPVGGAVAQVNAFGFGGVNAVAMVEVSDVR